MPIMDVPANHPDGGSSNPPEQNMYASSAPHAQNMQNINGSDSSPPADPWVQNQQSSSAPVVPVAQNIENSNASIAHDPNQMQNVDQSALQMRIADQLLLQEIRELAKLVTDNNTKLAKVIGDVSDLNVWLSALDQKVDNLQVTVDEKSANTKWWETPRTSEWPSQR